MSFASDFSAVVQHRDFRKLYFTRLAGQASDGMFQMALASYMFFSPSLGVSTPEPRLTTPDFTLGKIQT